MSHAIASTGQPDARTPLSAVCALTFLCSIGTGVVWAGIPFIAKHDYDMSKRSILALFLTLGATYVIGALSAGRGLRFVEARLSHRAVLTLILLVCTLASVALGLSDQVWLLWVVAVVINVVTSWLWPIVESYVTAGKHGQAMRNALGAWNITWTSAVVFSLFAMSPFVESHARWTLVGTSVAYVFALISLLAFSPRPGAHGEAGDDDTHDRRDYPHLLKSCRALLLTSYVLNSAMSPLLPFLIARLAVMPDYATPIAATWTVARVIVVTVMWKAGFWHGRWGTLLVGGVAMALGFCMIIASFTVPMLFAGLAIIGIGMAIVYYATLYYTMTVGASEVDASGGFEALIGLGYTAGPAAGLVGVMFTEQFSNTPLGPDGGVVVAALAIMLLLSILAMRPYFASKKPSGSDRE